MSDPTNAPPLEARITREWLICTSERAELRESNARLAKFARAVHALGDPKTVKDADLKRAVRRIIETGEALSREDLAQ